MRVAMGVLAFLALFAGLIQVPGVDEVDHPVPRAGLRGLAAGRDRPRPSAPPGSASAIGGAISIAGIGIAYFLYIAAPGDAGACWIGACAPLHTLLANKWYFDEAIDFLIVRPALAIGRFANRVFERFVVDGLVNGTERDGARAPAASSAPSRTASSAATRCCWSPASPASPSTS